jgi:hypothetical protein
VNDLLYKGNPQARAVTGGRSASGGRFRTGESNEKRFIHEKTTSANRYPAMRPIKLLYYDRPNAYFQFIFN